MTTRESAYLQPMNPYEVGTTEWEWWDAGWLLEDGENPPARAVCEEHCPDHVYVYDPMMRGKFCKTCGKQWPDDWD